MNVEEKITICSSNWYNEPYINLNHHLTCLYQSQDINWIVVDNSVNRIEELHESIKILDSVDAPPDKDGIGKGSFQHGLAFNKAKEYIKTDYVLFLDPDFFVIYPFDEIIEYMDNNQLTFFGAPYTNKKLITDFPVAYCLFVNLKCISVNDLDFQAGFDNEIYHDFYPDVGHKIYYHYKYIDTKHKYDTVTHIIPTRKRQVNIKTSQKDFAESFKYDKFWFNNKPFGIHTRCKLHRKHHWGKRISKQCKDASYLYHSLRYEYFNNKQLPITKSIEKAALKDYYS